MTNNSENGSNTNVVVKSVVEEGSIDINCSEKSDIPTIDISGVFDGEDGKAKIVNQISRAAEKWGVFQAVNHGVPLEVLENMIEIDRKFHEQDDEAKKQYYGGTRSKLVTYNFKNDFYKPKIPNWRESLCINTLFTDGKYDPQQFPSICRDAIVEYIKHITKLGDLLLELLSLALGLPPKYISELESIMSWNLDFHYYPKCPNPEINMGSGQHTDVGFMGILLQDQIGGLQVLNENKWVDVTPCTGALVVNIGDILEIMSNDKFKSVIHRVIIANKNVPRMSIPFFFRGYFASPKIYGPIKELLSEENKAAYKNFTIEELYTYNFNRVVGQPGIEFFKL